MLRTILALIILVHGLIHAMGFAKAFGLARMEQLSKPVSRGRGILWLLAANLFVITAVLFLANSLLWWTAAIPAVLLSQSLIFLSWQDARYGTIPNLIVVLAGAVGFGIWSFHVVAMEERSALLGPAAGATPRIVMSQNLETVPRVVRQWLKRSGVPGREAARAVYLRQKGELRSSRGGDWMPFEAEQWFVPGTPGFLWLAEVTAGPGIHLSGRDRFHDGQGHMLIKLLSLFPVADARGEEIDQGTALRYLAEIVWFPSAALEDYMSWAEVDSSTAEATMTVAGQTVSGLFRFDDRGDMVTFEARRYYDRNGGATLENWFVSAVPEGHREFDGIRVPARLDVTWKLNDGDFTWLRLEITDIVYNMRADP